MSQFCPVLGRDGTEIAPFGDIYDQPPGERCRIRGKLADHVEDHAVLSPKGLFLVTSPGTESSYPRSPQSLKHRKLIGVKTTSSGTNYSFSCLESCQYLRI